MSKSTLVQDDATFHDRAVTDVVNLSHCGGNSAVLTETKAISDIQTKNDRNADP
jgi:hypothetical protein